MSAYGEIRRKAATSQALARSQSKATYFKPTLAQVLSATRSLYEDELRPYGRILLKRIRERCAARRIAEGRGSATASSSSATTPPTRSASAAPTDLELSEVGMIDPKFLRRLCENCSVFQVDPAEGKEYSVTLAGHPGVFVDPCSARDPYPGHLWSEAAKYFEELKEEEGRFPSGRYACAQILKSRSLPFLKARSLGEICHIVQLAISQKKLLGYSEGRLVPYSRSEECLKERAAVRQQPVVNPLQQPEVPYASWEQVYEGLKALLESSSNPAPNMITLSNVKRLFRSHLNLELSETVLGYSRVGDLLQDPRLSCLCRLQALGNGQAVIRLIESLQPPSQPMSPQGTWIQVGRQYGQMHVSTPLAFQMQQSPSHQVYCGGDASRRELAMMAASSAAGSPMSSASPSCGASSCASNRRPTQQRAMAVAIPVSLLTTVPQSAEAMRLATNPHRGGDAGSRGVRQHMPLVQQEQPQQQQQQQQQQLQLPLLPHQVYHQEPMMGWHSEEDEAVYSHVAYREGASSSDGAHVEGQHSHHHHEHRERTGVTKERVGSDELLETRSLQSFNSTLASSTLVTTTSSEVDCPVRQEAPVSPSAVAAAEAGLIVRNTFWEFSPKTRRQGQKRSSSVPRSALSG